jgi:hypothetical protein
VQSCISHPPTSHPAIRIEVGIRQSRRSRGERVRDLYIPDTQNFNTPKHRRHHHNAHSKKRQNKRKGKKRGKPNFINSQFSLSIALFPVIFLSQIRGSIEVKSTQRNATLNQTARPTCPAPMHSMVCEGREKDFQRTAGDENGIERQRYVIPSFHPSFLCFLARQGSSALARCSLSCALLLWLLAQFWCRVMGIVWGNGEGKWDIGEGGTLHGTGMLKNQASSVLPLLMNRGFESCHDCL